MQGRGKLFEDLAQILNNAMGVAQGAKNEAETAMKSWFERWLADRDLVTREEFEAVRRMAQKAREENDALAARIDRLETELGEIRAMIEAATVKPKARRSAAKPASARPRASRKSPAARGQGIADKAEKGEG